jgi:hypothetical protein
LDKIDDIYVVVRMIEFVINHTTGARIHTILGLFWAQVSKIQSNCVRRKLGIRKHPWQRMAIGSQKLFLFRWNHACFGLKHPWCYTFSQIFVRAKVTWFIETINTISLSISSIKISSMITCTIVSM